MIAPADKVETLGSKPVSWHVRIDLNAFLLTCSIRCVELDSQRTKESEEVSNLLPCQFVMLDPPYCWGLTVMAVQEIV